MGILKKATNEQAYFKCGIYGDPGSGKTTTASYLAMAISEMLGHKKPVAFFETEAGSDFLVSRFELEGIELLRVKSHSLADLLAAGKEAEQACSVLIVDSLTHVWANLLESKLTAINEVRKGRGQRPIAQLEFQHYNDVKRQWAQWTALYLNSKIHILACGRAGDIWQHVQNEETGKKELQSSGTRFSAEKNFGYEPSLTIEMRRIDRGDGKPGFKHRATILKDRSDTINGKFFDFEKQSGGYKKGGWKTVFNALEPAIMSLNVGADHNTFDATRNAQELFPGTEGDSGHDMYGKRKEIALEEIKHSLTTLYPGQDGASKMAKSIILEEVLGERVWSAVEMLKLEELDGGAKFLRKLEKSMQGIQLEGLEDVRNWVRNEVEKHVTQ
jgi:hypothetical protein